MATQAPPELPNEWCVCANVKPEAFGRATSTGTRHFAAGAKVWVLPFGTDWVSVRTIGRHRGSPLHIFLRMRAEYLTNWRAKQTFHPAVIRLIVEHGRWASQEACAQTAAWMMTRREPIADIRGEAAVLGHALHLLNSDPRGRELDTLAQAALGARTHDQRKTPQADLPPEVLVLADFLEDHGVGLPLDQLITTLERRRQNR